MKKDNYHKSPIPDFQDVPTPFQVKKHKTFSPEVIRERDPQMWGRNEDDPRTLRLAKPGEWTTEAACLDNWELFDNENRYAQAKKVCGGCPMRARCLSDALEEEAGLGVTSRYLIRGGKTPAERAEAGYGPDQREAPAS